MSLTTILLNILILLGIVALIKMLWKSKTTILKTPQQKDYLELHELPQYPLNRIRSPNLKDNASNVESYNQQPNIVLRALKVFGTWLIKVLKKMGENYKANMALKAQEEKKLKGKDKMKKGYLAQVAENYQKETSINFNVPQENVIGNFNFNPNINSKVESSKTNSNTDLFKNWDNMFKIGGK